MTIQYVTGSAVQQTFTQANPSMSVDVGTGTDRLLVVVILSRGSIDRTVTAITYNGTTLSHAVSTTHADTLKASLYYLVNPSSGSNTLSVTYDSTTGTIFSVHASAFIGVAQTAPLDDFDSATGTSTAISVTLTPTEDSELIVGGFVHEGLQSSTANDTELTATDQGAWNTGAAYIVQTTAAAEALDWTNGASDIWHGVAASFKAAAAGNTSPTVVLNTVNNQTFSTATPTLEFTGTDADDDDVRYQIQISDTLDFVSTNRIDSLTLTDGGTFHPQPTTATAWTGYPQVDDRFGQGITASAAGRGGILDKISMYVSSGSSTSGSAVVRMYTHVGTYGTDGSPANAAAASDTPTGSWLAESASVEFLQDVAASWVDFGFTGTNRIWLDGGSHYFLIQDWWASFGDTNNTITYWGASPTEHGGNAYVDGAGPNWGVRTDFDISFQLHVSNELLSKVSGTDSGFVNTVTGGDTDPFNSGEKVSFTIQSGDELTNGRVYYWKVRAIDPSGTNAYGDWSEVRQFTITLGEGTTYNESVGIGRRTNFSPVNNLIVEGAMSLGRSGGLLDGGGGLNGVSSLSVGKILSESESNQIIAEGQAAVRKTDNINQAGNIDTSGSLSISRIAAILSSGGLAIADSISMGRLVNVGEEALAEIAGAIAIGRQLNIQQTAILAAESSIIVDAQKNIFLQNVVSVENSVALLGKLVAVIQDSDAGGGVIFLFSPVGGEGVIGSIIVRGVR